jgi:hypothetical protein
MRELGGKSVNCSFHIHHGNANGGKALTGPSRQEPNDMPRSMEAPELNP